MLINSLINVNYPREIYCLVLLNDQVQMSQEQLCLLYGNRNVIGAQLVNKLLYIQLCHLDTPDHHDKTSWNEDFCQSVFQPLLASLYDIKKDPHIPGVPLQPIFFYLTTYVGNHNVTLWLLTLGVRAHLRIRDKGHMDDPTLISTHGRKGSASLLTLGTCGSALGK